MNQKNDIESKIDSMKNDLVNLSKEYGNKVKSSIKSILLKHGEDIKCEYVSGISRSIQIEEIDKHITPSMRKDIEHSLSFDNFTLSIQLREINIGNNEIYLNINIDLVLNNYIDFDVNFDDVDLGMETMRDIYEYIVTKTDFMNKISTNVIKKVND